MLDQCILWVTKQFPDGPFICSIDFHLFVLLYRILTGWLLWLVPVELIRVRKKSYGSDTSQRGSEKTLMEQVCYMWPVWFLFLRFFNSVSLVAAMCLSADHIYSQYWSVNYDNCINLNCVRAGLLLRKECSAVGKFMLKQPCMYLGLTLYFSVASRLVTLLLSHTKVTTLVWLHSCHVRMVSL